MTLLNYTAENVSLHSVYYTSILIGIQLTVYKIFKKYHISTEQWLRQTSDYTIQTVTEMQINCPLNATKTHQQKDNYEK